MASSGRVLALVRRLLLAVAALGVWAAPAAAEVVVLANGRSVAVKAHRYDGDEIVLVLKSGGELVCEARAVDRIEPDDLPDVSLPAPAVLAGAGLPLDRMIEAVAAGHGVDVRLVRAVIQVESAFRPDALSPKGAMGLMQLMPATVIRYAVRDPYEPVDNLNAGVRHLRRLLERYEVPVALAAYNAGEAAVERYRGIPPYRETIDYVRRVVGLLERSLADTGDAR